MSVRMRVLESTVPDPEEVKNIILNGKGMRRVVINDEIFERVPYENAHAQGIVVGDIDVFLGSDPEDESTWTHELDLNGVWQIAPNAVTEETAGGNDLIMLSKVEWVRNPGV